MEPITSTHGDPFADPAVEANRSTVAADLTLSLGRNVALSLGTDSLIILGKDDGT